MIVDGWLDWAERVDGPANKQFAQRNAGIGIACHSVVGSLRGHTVPSRFFDPNDEASVMFILYRDGHVTQMYPVTSSTWTSGSFEANTNYWAIEAEGGGPPDYGEKLTRAAEDAFIRIVTEWEAHTGRKADPGVNILQHKDLARKYNSGPTACASDRYSNAWDRIAAGERYGDDMSAEDRARLDRLERIVAGNHLTTEVWDGNVDTLKAVGISAPIVGTVIGLTGEQALKYADLRGFSFALGVKLAQDSAADTNTKIDEHIANHAAGLYSGKGLGKGAKFTAEIIE